MKFTSPFHLSILALALPFSFSQAATPLPRSTPEAQGISSTAVRAYIEAADKQINTLHSFMLVRHGHVIAEAWWQPEAADKKHVMWSLSKSFNSTAVGLAIEEGKLSLEDPVLKFFPDDAPAKPRPPTRSKSRRDMPLQNVRVEPSTRSMRRILESEESKLKAKQAGC